jgi:VanZ family protein
LVFIFYVSLQPLPSALLPVSLERAISQSLPEPVGIHDLGHMIEFSILGALLLRWSAWRFSGRGLAVILLVAFSAAFLSALADETIQYFTPGRAFELDDIALNMAAASLGMGIVWVVHRMRKQLQQF